MGILFKKTYGILSILTTVMSLSSFIGFYQYVVSLDNEVFISMYLFFIIPSCILTSFPLFIGLHRLITDNNFFIGGYTKMMSQPIKHEKMARIMGIALVIGILLCIILMFIGGFMVDISSVLESYRWLFHLSNFNTIMVMVYGFYRLVLE